MERVQYLSNFGTAPEAEPILILSEALALTYWVLVTAMRGFTAFAIPIWAVIVIVLGTLPG